jgi:hypothetical protein
MNPKDQTYWKMPLKGAATAMQAAGMTPEVTLKPTGELETVAGVQCARSTFTMKMNLPIPESAKASLGPNFPSSLDMDGDTCATTDQFQKYGAIASKTQVTGILAALGLDQLMPGGIVLRQTIRLGGVDIRSVVTEIAEEEAPAGTFEIPAGYKEVPPPAAPHSRGRASRIADRRATGAPAGAERGSWGPASEGVRGSGGRSPQGLGVARRIAHRLQDDVADDDERQQHQDGNPLADAGLEMIAVDCDPTDAGPDDWTADR